MFVDQHSMNLIHHFPIRLQQNDDRDANTKRSLVRLCEPGMLNLVLVHPKRKWDTMDRSFEIFITIIWSIKTLTESSNIVTEAPCTWLYEATANSGCFKCQQHTVLTASPSKNCAFVSKYSVILIQQNVAIYSFATKQFLWMNLKRAMNCFGQLHLNVSVLNEQNKPYPW